MPDARLWRVVWLTLALIAAQTVGLLHDYVHLGGHGIAQPVAADDFPSASHARGHQVPQAASLQTLENCDHAHGLSSLFAGHDEESAACLSFDQLGHFDVLMGHPLNLSPALTSLRLVLANGLAVARWHAQFQARGPPKTH